MQWVVFLCSEVFSDIGVRDILEIITVQQNFTISDKIIYICISTTHKLHTSSKIATLKNCGIVHRPKTIGPICQPWDVKYMHALNFAYVKMSKKYILCPYTLVNPSVLWHCCLGSRKGIRPINTWVMRCWHGYRYLSGAKCKWLAYGLADATAPPPSSLLQKIQNSLSFWYRPTQVVPEKRLLNDCVCVYLSCHHN